MVTVVFVVMAAVAAVRAAAAVAAVPYRDIGREFSRRFSACDECFFVPRWGFVHRHGKVLLSLLVPVHPPEGWAAFSGWHFSAAVVVVMAAVVLLDDESSSRRLQVQIQIQMQIQMHVQIQL